jgi:hypothetical protein
MDRHVVRGDEPERVVGRDPVKAVLVGEVPGDDHVVVGCDGETTVEDPLDEGVPIEAAVHGDVSGPGVPEGCPEAGQRPVRARGGHVLHDQHPIAREVHLPLGRQRVSGAGAGPALLGRRPAGVRVAR